MLTRFWIEFQLTGLKEIPPGLRLGCGVTAYSLTDALNIIQERVFKENKIPEINILKENIDISTLDQGHVIPNMYPPDIRGIWFPFDYHDKY